MRRGKKEKKKEKKKEGTESFFSLGRPPCQGIFAPAITNMTIKLARQERRKKEERKGWKHENAHRFFRPETPRGTERDNQLSLLANLRPEKNEERGKEKKKKKKWGIQLAGTYPWGTYQGGVSALITRASEKNTPAENFPGSQTG